MAGGLAARQEEHQQLALQARVGQRRLPGARGVAQRQQVRGYRARLGGPGLHVRQQRARHVLRALECRRAAPHVLQNEIRVLGTFDPKYGLTCAMSCVRWIACVLRHASCKKYTHHQLSC